MIALSPVQWNSHGYDVAKTFGAKFTYISPVWLQVRRMGPNRFEMHGTHDIDKGITIAAHVWLLHSS